MKMSCSSYPMCLSSVEAKDVVPIILGNREKYLSINKKC